MERPPKDIRWQDLASISPRQRLIELTLPLPWLALSWALYASALWPLGALASFMFFLCALRLNHEAIHSNLGLTRRVDSIVMHGLSAIMLGSNHADAWCHLRHHADVMGPDDHEGHCSRMRWYQVLAYGPRFPVDLNLAVLRHATPRWRRKLALDWIAIIGVLIVAALLDPGFLWLHLGAMAMAQCLTAFFAVWITHQGTEHGDLAGRSQRGPLARLAYLMFYHREHHLFPRVPVSRLPDLAARLDTKAPGYAATRIPVIPILDRQ